MTSVQLPSLAIPESQKRAYNQIEDSLRVQVTQAIHVSKPGDAPAIVGEYGRWLTDRPEALRRMKQLYERKVAEIGNSRDDQVAGEIVTQAVRVARGRTAGSTSTCATTSGSSTRVSPAGADAGASSGP